jgi:hypothetical protein
MHTQTLVISAFEGSAQPSGNGHDRKPPAPNHTKYERNAAAAAARISGEHAKNKAQKCRCAHSRSHQVSVAQKKSMKQDGVCDTNHSQ